MTSEWLILDSAPRNGEHWNHKNRSGLAPEPPCFGGESNRCDIALSNRERSTDDSKLFQRSKNISTEASVPFIVHPSDARERL
jgi:hypothetical protein